VLEGKQSQHSFAVLPETSLPMRWVHNSHAAMEEKAASLGVGYLGHPVTADGVSEKQRINRNTI